MTAIWHHNDEGGWRLLPPSSFPDEANLHDLVEEAPHLLPLAGSPRLVVDIDSPADRATLCVTQPISCLPL